MEMKRFNWYHEVTRKTLTCRQIYKSIRGTLSSPSLPVFLPEGIPEKLHPSWNPEPGQTGEQGAQLTAPPPWFLSSRARVSVGQSCLLRDCFCPKDS